MRFLLLFLPSLVLAQRFEPLDFRIERQTLSKQQDPAWQWFHPRPAAIPGFGQMITLQKHLFTSDYYGGLAVMTSRDSGRHWNGPGEVPELGWSRESDSVDVAVADVTPGWHRKSKRLIAIGARVRYDKKGHQLEDRQRSNQTAYAVFDPRTGKWQAWRTIEMPPDAKFEFARSACAQWLERDGGTVLLPFYYGPSAKAQSVTVAEFRFDGSELKYLHHGSEHHLSETRGLAEPSIIRFQGRYYLTVRSDSRAYVAVSGDGLQFPPLREWLFDDGAPLGSYNTQQHWLAHSDGLFLAYTRRGAGNDHVFRHRAPLFLAQVDPATLRVVRATEKILMRDRGATFGNFGAAAIDPAESWVTDAEGMFFEVARQRGAEGALLLARVIWSKPNRAVQRP